MHRCRGTGFVALACLSAVVLLAPAVAAAQEVETLVTQLKSPRLAERIAAAEALSRRAPDIKPALPALVAALRDEYWDVRRHASDALRKAGPAAADLLIESLDHPHYYARWYAARTLRQIRPPVAEAVKPLAARLDDEAVDVRVEAARALEAIGQTAPVVDELIRAMAGRDASVRSAAAAATATAGKAAVPGLVRLLAHGDLDVRRTAAIALGEIGPEAAAAVDGLIALLRAECEAVRTRYADEPGAILVA